MIGGANFDALVERAMQSGNRAHMRPVVEKELLHYDVLFALDSEDLLDRMTFQGGTCLRLCYGSARYSEDLDFAGGSDFSASRLTHMKTCIERQIGARYGLEVTVREPKEGAGEPTRPGIHVHKWQIRVLTSPGRPDLPKQMIKIEVVNIPAYTRAPQALRPNYDFLPDGYGDMLVMAETLDEIMADKLVSLVHCAAYIRHRDIWDLRWLAQQGAAVDADLVSRKLADYGVLRYAAGVDRMIERLPAIVHGKEFTQQMSRFIPMDVQEKTLRKAKFLDFLAAEIARLLMQARQGARDD